MTVVHVLFLLTQFTEFMSYNEIHIAMEFIDIFKDLDFLILFFSLTSDKKDELSVRISFLELPFPVLTA